MSIYHREVYEQQTGRLLERVKVGRDRKGNPVARVYDGSANLLDTRQPSSGEQRSLLRIEEEEYWPSQWANAATVAQKLAVIARRLGLE